MTAPINGNPQTPRVSYALAAVAAAQGPVTASPKPAATTPQSPLGTDDMRKSATTSQTPAAAVDLTSPQTEAAPPELFVNDQNQIVTADGQPYLNTALFLGPNDTVVDAQGQPVDVAALEAQAGIRPATSGQAGATANPNADPRVIRHIKMATAGASGALGVGMDYLWYRATLGGMERRVSSLQTASRAFKTGTSLQGKLKSTPVIGGVVSKIQKSRTGKIQDLQRSIKLSKMNPTQEGHFIAKERIKALQAESKAFRKGETMMGRLKDAPVVGSVAKGLENRRQATIKRLQTEIKTPATQSSTWTKVKNGTRGRIFPAIMLASDGYSVYQGVKKLNEAGNTRKWDDALRIGGNAVSAVGDVMAFKRGHIGGAVATHAAGVLIGTLGNVFDDQ